MGTLLNSYLHWHTFVSRTPREGSLFVMCNQEIKTEYQCHH